MQREASWMSGPGDPGPKGIDQALAALPSHDFDLCCEEWLLMLDEELRQYAVLRLLGHTNRDIAGIFQCTERKVERKLNLIRQIWSEALDATEDGDD